MARYSDTLTDQYGRPVAGALVSVVVSNTGGLAVLTADDGSALLNPLETASDGTYYFNTPDGYVDLTFRFGGRVIAEKFQIAVGNATLPTGLIANSLGAATNIAPSQNAVQGARFVIPSTNNQVPLQDLSDFSSPLLMTFGGADTSDNGASTLSRKAPLNGGSYSISDMKGTAFYITDQTRKLEQYITSTDVISGQGEDWAPILARALLDSSGRTILFDREKFYKFASNTRFDAHSIHIDGNGSKIIAPNGFISSNPARVTLSAGNYFTTVAGSVTFVAPSGLLSVVQRGDFLQIRSNSVYLASGSYLYGQQVRVLDVNYTSGIVTIDDPFFAAYQVDAIQCIPPLDYEFERMTLDMSGAIAPTSGNPAIGFNLNGNRTRFNDIDAIGSSYAGSAFTVTGMEMSAENCSATGFLDIEGIPNGSGGSAGRLGYGFATAARESYIRSCSGSGNKHSFTASSRLYRTRRVSVVDCWATTPSGHESDQTIYNNELLYQAQFDCHANTEYYELIRPRFDGVNVAIAVRNGHAYIEAPVFTTRGFYGGLAGGATMPPGLILIYEEPVRNVTVKDAIVNSNPIPTNDQLPYLFCVDQYANHNGPIRAINTRLQGSGDIGLFRGQGSASTAASIMFDLVSIEAEGSFKDGIVFGRNNPVGTVSRVELIACGPLATIARGNTEGDNGAQAAIYISPTSLTVGDIYVDLERGGLDASTLRNIQAAPFTIGGTSAGSISPKSIRCKGALLSARGGWNIADAAGAPAPSRYDFSGMRLTYNVAAGATAPGVYLNTQLAPADPVRFSGSRMINSTSAGTSGAEAIRMVGAGLLDTTEMTVNAELSASGTYIMPVTGLRKVNNGNVLVPGTGTVYINGAGTYFSTSTPTTAMGSGTIVYNQSPAVGSPKGWVNTTGTTWVSIGNL